MGEWHNEVNTSREVEGMRKSARSQWDHGTMKSMNSRATMNTRLWTITTQSQAPLQIGAKLEHLIRRGKAAFLQVALPISVALNAPWDWAGVATPPLLHWPTLAVFLSCPMQMAGFQHWSAVAALLLQTAQLLFIQLLPLGFSWCS